VALSKLRSIQVLRGLAALAVVLNHVKFLRGGSVGVDIFFVISGFIIATVAPGRRAREFLKDRVRRIYPVYWVAALPWLYVAYRIGFATNERTISSLTLWPIYGDYANPYLRVAWTLCFEMLFYVAATVAIIRGVWLPLAIYAACFVGNLVWPVPLLSFLGSPIILEFLAGAALTKAPRNELMAPALVIAALIALLWAPVYGRIGIHQPLARVLFWGVPAMMLVYGALSLERVLGKWAEPLVKLGDASYSLYLWHLGVCVLLPPILAVPTSIAVAFVSHRFIEKPFLKRSSPSDRRRASDSVSRYRLLPAPVPPSVG
jgi:exopolysaccharide production protein ExoZ